MIQRVVTIALKPAYQNEEDRAQLVHSSHEILAAVPGVRELRVATAADERCRREWDVCLLLQFDDLEAVETYRAHPAHRAYVDELLKPIMKSIRVLNFELA